jgi:hypothetical protein
MAPAAKARRVSYVIPPPQQTAQRLVLPALDAPRSGRSIPLIIPATHNGENTPIAPSSPTSGYFANPPNHPQHRLGVTSLALDTTTSLAGRGGPEGILYTGGRDGLIVAWEQAVSMKQRKYRYGREDSAGQFHSSGRWEALTGWDDDDFDSEDEEDEYDVSTRSPNIPFEDRWQPDYDNLGEHKVCFFALNLCPSALANLFGPSLPHSASAYNLIQIGSMISLFAIITVPVGQACRLSRDTSC